MKDFTVLEEISRTQTALVRILAIDPDGLPQLENHSGAVVLLDPLQAAAVGQFAVVRPLETPKGVSIVLAVLSQQQLGQALGASINEEGPLVLRHGKAAIELHADGRVRLNGEDVVLNANGPMTLTAAKIDLN